MLEKVLFTLNYLKITLRTFVYRNYLFYKRNKLSKEDVKIVEKLFKNGIYAIEGYWSEEKCKKIKLELEQRVLDGKNKDFKSGAYVRARSNDLNFDNGVIRMYHADKEVDGLCSFRFDRKISNIAEAYYGYPVFSSFIAFQHNKPSEKGTRGYHVDGWVDEFKAFLYLEDVNKEKGPFAYLKGSNNAFIKRYKRMIKRFDGLKPNTSFSEKETGEYSKKEIALSAKAGTLILADVSGFHRGLPQLSTTRSLIYNNFFSKDVQLFLEK